MKEKLLVQLMFQNNILTISAYPMENYHKVHNYDKYTFEYKNLFYKYHNIFINPPSKRFCVVWLLVSADCNQITIEKPIYGNKPYFLNNGIILVAFFGDKKEEFYLRKVSVEDF